MVEWFWQYVTAIAIFIAVALLCIPAENRHSLSGRIRGIMFGAISAAIWSVALILMRCGLNYLHLRPLLKFDLTAIDASSSAAIHFVLAIALALIPTFIVDGWFYWFHRLQHSVPLLWRFHAVHHSVEELNAANCFHHWSEGIIRLPLMYLPLALLIDVKVTEVVAITLLVYVWSQLIHADTAATFGPIGKIFVSPHYHRVHHSLEQRHMHRNFAGYFPIFDWIFGTAYFPARDEAIRTGLSDRHEPRNLQEYLIALRAKD